MVRVNSPVVAPTLSGTSSRSPAIHFVERGTLLKTKVEEASDVVSIGDHFLVVADRKRTAKLVSFTGESVDVKFSDLASGNSQLEGVAYDPEHQHLFVVRESKGELIRYEWHHEHPKSEPVFEHTTEIEPGAKNKGAEGLVFVKNSQVFDGKARLVVAIEGDRSMLLAFNGKGEGKPQEIALDRQIAEHMRDFSAITVDPRTGHLFIGSDESKAVAQIAVVKKGDNWVGNLVHSFQPLDKDGKKLKKIEGITFDKAGTLYVLSENKGHLYSYARLNERSSI